MSTNHDSLPCHTDLAVNDSGGAFHPDVSIAGNHRRDGNSPSPPDPDAPLPRPQRRPRRAKADRGLPPDEELASLARAYLDRQRKHWPKMAEAGLLPAPEEKIIRLMVADFKERHRTGKVDLDTILPFREFCEKFGGLTSVIPAATAARRPSWTR